MASENTAPPTPCVYSQSFFQEPEHSVNPARKLLQERGVTNTRIASYINTRIAS